MKSDGLTAHNWQVITEYIDTLGPLKTATKRLEGHGQGNFGLVAEIIPVFEVLLHKLEQQLEKFDSVNHEEHAEAPEDHLAINLRAALIKAREYYSKLDETPAYYAATILHPRYKLFCDTVWAENLSGFRLITEILTLCGLSIERWPSLEYGPKRSPTTLTTRSIASVIPQDPLTTTTSILDGAVVSQWQGRTPPTR
jgi:hypothetical protein